MFVACVYDLLSIPRSQLFHSPLPLPFPSSGSLPWYNNIYPILYSAIITDSHFTTAQNSSKSGASPSAKSPRCCVPQSSIAICTPSSFPIVTRSPSSSLYFNLAVPRAILAGLIFTILLSMRSIKDWCLMMMGTTMVTCEGRGSNQTFTLSWEG